MTATEDGGGPLERRKSLELLGTFIHIDVVTAIQSALVRTVASGFFHKNKDAFAWNPANTLLYQSLRALEERAVVHISETLKDPERIFEFPTDLRGRIDLELHRTALSHPGTVRWRKAGMQEFFDADRHWRDNRAAIVWDLQRSINEELAKVGAEPKLTSVAVTPEMAVLVSAILRCSVRAESRETIPPEKMLLDWLNEKQGEWIKILETISLARGG
jgi:hypothetical protein